ncbi:procathepsin L-like isoform X1 [Hemitrygon akajei]|uniref:procathepsin L-like isoform X1 n=2 Tax=Hemitrygon akajei TaxID=2704970 RepID=UPI003BF94A69
MLSMMKFTLFLGFVVGFILTAASDYTFNTELDEEWEKWKLQHSKQYTEDEEINRRMIWESAMSYIEQHNREYEMGKHTFTVAMNQFGDLTNEEFNTLMNGFLSNEAENSTEEEFEEFDDDNEDGFEIPRTVDWRSSGMVTPVKNQGSCGSCWAFSATGALEGQWKRRHSLISLSEQNLLDCDRGSHGCRGGFMGSAFRCIWKKGGIESEKTYPYVARKGNCKFQRRRAVARLRGYRRVRRCEPCLARKVAKVGPIAVAINARHRSFQFYKRGVYYDRRCGNRVVNHAVLLVGYGSMGGMKYWLIKNSWGTAWGDKGYIKMAKDRRNHCGITNYALYPVV